MSIYTLEEPISTLDGNDLPSEPYKKLKIINPPEGNYILKIFGTGDGPYTIHLQSTTDDGIDNLNSFFTGTATPSLYEIYRVTYSPTGEASLSQTNIAPIANAGASQAGEQSYEITLDGSGSNDPDGDPITYAWSFMSKPEGSTTSLSDVHAIKPTFTPDMPGTYTLQLVVNDHFTDSAASTVTVTAIPVKSRISMTPNFLQSFSAGTSFISFDVNNIGRVGVSAGAIDISLTDPEGSVVYAGSQAFMIGIGETKSIAVPVTIPPLKFGSYSLTYTQSDETRTGSPTTAQLLNTASVEIAFDKVSYRVRETASLTLTLKDTGKFNQDDIAVTVAMPDTGYSETKNVSLRANDVSANMNFSIPIPGSIAAGQHSITVTLTAPSGGTIIRDAKLSIPQSVLSVKCSNPSSVSVGDSLNIEIANAGGADTSFASEKLTLTDSKSAIIYQNTLSGIIAAGETRTVTALQIPAQTKSGQTALYASLRNVSIGATTNCFQAFTLSGTQVNLSARTDKDVYSTTEPITSISTLENGAVAIESGILEVKVLRTKEPGRDGFTHFLPLSKKEWAPLNGPQGVAFDAAGFSYVMDDYSVLKFDPAGNLVTSWGGYCSSRYGQPCDGKFLYPYGGLAVSADGFVYVTDYIQIQKFDTSGNFIMRWGDSGSGDGQFNFPWGIAVSSDGSVYVADTNNNRVQKFDRNGVFISKWGSLGSLPGKFNNPVGVAASPDGTVYVADKNNSRIQKFSSTGTFLASWGSWGIGNGKFQQPWGIGIFTDGSVYVSDYYGHNIQKFTGSGDFVLKWGIKGKADGQFDSPRGLAVGPDGSVTVADWYNSRIQKFDSSGIFLSKLGPGIGNGTFNEPAGVAIGPDDSLYVMDRRNDLVQRFDRNGNFISQWGSQGSGNGQFYYPSDVAVGLDGSVYVADGGNWRMQKFDRDGNFLLSFGSGYISATSTGPAADVYGLDTYFGTVSKYDTSGTFIKNWTMNGYGLDIGADGAIYLPGYGSVSKYDKNGKFLQKWGTYGSGDGQIYIAYDLDVSPDGTIFLTDSGFSEGGNGRVQQFDSRGAFISKWGQLGFKDGQFNGPNGIAVASDGTVYVADSRNHRIQRMLPASSTGTAFETLFEAAVPINQAGNILQDYTSLVGALNATGKLVLQVVAKNNLGQTLASSEYPFYIVEGSTLLAIATDKKVYKTGETVTVSGEVRNLSDVDARSISLSVIRKAEGGTDETVYKETFDVPVGSSHPYTFSTTATENGTVLLTGTATQNGIVLTKVMDQYAVSTPVISLAIVGPDVTNKDPFELAAEVKNEGKVEVAVNLTSSVDGQTQPITISAGESKRFTYVTQIMSTMTYTFTLSGDVMKSASKTVVFGENASIQFGMVPSINPVGRVSVPVSVANTGTVDETIEVTYLFSQKSTNLDRKTKQYFLPKNATVNDTLYYDLIPGSYQVAGSIILPSASAQTTFDVAAENIVTMTATAGSQGLNGLIPVTVNILNNGYNHFNGSISLAVMNNDGKAVWRGETLVSGLKSQATGTYTINVDSTGISSGAYAADVNLYSSSGLLLAATQIQVRVLGPIFEITSVPANPAFTVGKQALFNFTVKNTGTASGTATFSIKAMDILNQSSSLSLQPGQEQALTFNFMVPENAIEQEYLAEYNLIPALSQATKGRASFSIREVKVDVTGSLDKQAYRNGETAVLTLNVSRLSQTENGTYIAIIRYGSYNAMEPFTLSSQPATLMFNVPLARITGERLFYGIHFESGNAIYRSSIALNEALADLAAGFNGQISDDGTLIPEVKRDNTVEIQSTVMNYGKTASPATSLDLYDSDTLIETKSVKDLNPGESAAASTIWNVLGKGGDRLLRAVVDPQDSVAEYSEENNTNSITMRVPALTIFTDADKETYKIRQKVYITSTITNLTSGTTYTNLLQLTSAKDSSGKEAYSKSVSLGSLGQTNSTTSNQVWNTAGLLLDGVYAITDRLFAGSALMTQSTKTIMLEKAPDFFVTVDAASKEIRQGEQATYTASIDPFSGWNHEVAFNMEGLPTGATASFNPDRLVPPGQTLATVQTTNTTAAGTHILYLTGSGTDEGEIVTHTAQLTLDVSAFNIESLVPSATVKQLEQAIFPITISSVNGYQGTINLTASGLPKGTRGSFDTVTAKVPGTANLSIQTSKYAKPGTYTVTATGDDGLVQHAATLTLVIQPNPEIAAGIIATEGPGPQNDSTVRLYSANLQLIREFTAFNTKYGAVAVSADIDGDGYDEIIVGQGPDPKNDAVLRAFKKDGTLIAEYKAFTGKYGVTLASADLDGDWVDEIIVGMGPDPKNPAILKVLKYSNGAFTQVVTHTVDSQASYGLNVAAGDIDGDCVPEIITASGPGPNNPAIVNIWKYTTNGLVLSNTITAFDGSYGVNIAAGDVDGDGRAEIVAGTGPDPKSTATVRIYKTDGFLVSEFTPYDAKHAYGVTISSADLNRDGIAEILTGLGPGPQNEPLMKIFSLGGTEAGSLMAFPEMKYGVRVSGGNVGR